MDKTQIELIQEVFAALKKAPASVLFGESNHPFYLLGAIANDTATEVNRSDSDGAQLLEFMRATFSHDHQVWDHVEFVKDEDDEDGNE